MKATKWLCALLLTVIAGQVLAANRPNFNYAGLGYTYQDLDSFACDQDGLFLEGSLSYDEQIFIAAKHVDVTSDGYDCGSTTTSVSLGLRGDIGTTSVLYGKATFLYRDYGSDADPGLGLSFGARSIISNGLEAEGFIGHESVDSYSESYIGGALNYWISPDFSLRGSLTSSSESTTTLGLGIRLNF